MQEEEGKWLMRREPVQCWYSDSLKRPLRHVRFHSSPVHCGASALEPRRPRTRRASGSGATSSSSSTSYLRVRAQLGSRLKRSWHGYPRQRFAQRTAAARTTAGKRCARTHQPLAISTLTSTSGQPAPRLYTRRCAGSPSTMDDDTPRWMPRRGPPDMGRVRVASCAAISSSSAVSRGADP